MDEKKFTQTRITDYYIKQDVVRKNNFVFEHILDSTNEIKAKNKRNWNLLRKWTDIIDVLCFSETFLKGDYGCGQLDGYELAEHFSRKYSWRGGVCIFVKKSIKYNRLEWLYEFSVEENFECCGITLQAIVLCLYRSGKNKELLLYKLESLLYKLTRRQRNLSNKVILVGCGWSQHRLFWRQ